MTRFIGLTGGIGSGKSTVAERFAALGARVVDADVIAREVVEPGTDGLAAVVASFGEEVLRDDGTLDRGALAAKVFGDDDARATLNALLHPRIGAATQRAFTAIAAEDPDAVVVHDMPLLVENDLAGGYEAVVVVLADEDLRVRRLAEHRGMDEADARARIASQATDEQRRAVATHVIDNDGTVEQLHARVDAVWAALTGTGAGTREGPAAADVPPLRIRHQVVAFDAADMAAESAFWAGVLGGVVDVDEDWHMVHVDGEPRVGVQLAPDHVPPDWPDGDPPQQVHVDLWVDDIAAAHETVTRLGARLLREANGNTSGDDWQVYADPAGHPFCLCWLVDDSTTGP